MAEAVKWGRVIEVRPKDNMMVILPHGRIVEETITDIKPTEARPGNYVWVYDDGQVEVKSPGDWPANVTERTLPHQIETPQQDHS